MEKGCDTIFDFVFCQDGEHLEVPPKYLSDSRTYRNESWVGEVIDAFSQVHLYSYFATK